MRVAIMQPTWLPWMGYFDLIDQVDLFVFLDNVQFCPRSWHSRNKIRTSTGTRWVSLPVSGQGRDQTTLMSATVACERMPKKLIETLKHEYGSASAFQTESEPLFEQLLSIQKGMRLADVNIGLIQYAMDRLGICTDTVRASALPHFAGRIERLIGINNHLGAETYVSAPGSAAYMDETGLCTFEDAGLSLVFHRYDHPVYRQVGKGFTGYMSIVDLLLNMGEAAPIVLRAGNRSPVPAREFLANSKDTDREQENTFGAA